MLQARRVGAALEGGWFAKRREASRQIFEAISNRLGPIGIATTAVTKQLSSPRNIISTPTSDPMAHLYPAHFHFAPLAAALSAELAAQMTASPAMEAAGDGWLVKMSVPGLSSKVNIINLHFCKPLTR